jgi:uncharacterized membrane-anchored protein
MRSNEESVQLDPRERNAQAHDKQQERVANSSKLEEMDKQIDTMSVQEITDNLSKRNSDYVFKMRKLLSDEGYSDQKIDTEMAPLLPDILKAQRRGTPANQLYGAPTVKANSIIHKPAPVQKTPFWKKLTDSTLMFMGALAGMYGIVGMFTKTSSATNRSTGGLISIIMISIIWGFALTKLNDYMRIPKGERPKMGKTIVYVMFVIVVVFAVLGLAPFIPAVINPILPPIGLIIFAAIALGGRYVFRRYFHIKDSIFAPNLPPRPSK